jgi:hypothetical protein
LFSFFVSSISPSDCSVPIHGIEAPLISPDSGVLSCDSASSRGSIRGWTPRKASKFCCRVPPLRILLMINSTLLATLLLFGMWVFSNATSQSKGTDSTPPISSIEQRTVIATKGLDTHATTVLTTMEHTLVFETQSIAHTSTPPVPPIIDKPPSALEVTINPDQLPAVVAAEPISEPTSIPQTEPQTQPQSQTQSEPQAQTQKPIDTVAPVIAPVVNLQTESEVAVDDTKAHHSADLLLSGNFDTIAHYTEDRHTAFMFPRPSPRSSSSSLFVVAISDKGAGIGHQFGEWVYGVYIALMFNATYIHHEFEQNGARWNHFLGFGFGEDRVEDFLATFAPNVADIEIRPGSNQIQTLQEIQQKTNAFHLFHRRWEDETAENGRFWDWMPNYIQTLREESKSEIESHPSPLTPAHAILDPDIPKPALLYFEPAHIQPPNAVCSDPRLLQSLRKKYCIARVTQSGMDDLYEVDRNRNSLIVALHLRCGDSCYDSFRTTPFHSVVHTVQRLHALLSLLEPDRPIVFHIFSQKPLNGSAEEHFAPLLTSLQGVSVTTHFETSSYSTLHHLILSDILVGAQSSFSWLAFLLHHGVSMGPFTSCTSSIDYSKDTGVFDEGQFEIEYQHAKLYGQPTPSFKSWKECSEIVPHSQYKKIQSGR